MGGSVRLYDPYDPGNLDHYTGRWVATIDPFDPPEDSDGYLFEFQFEVPIQGVEDAFAFFYLGNDGETPVDPADFAVGFTFDSDAPETPTWVTYYGEKLFNTGGTYNTGSWPPERSRTNAKILDGAYGEFDLGFVITVDEASDPSWLPPPPVPAYEVIVVDQDGTPFGTVANARLGNVSWELNGPGAAEVMLATTDDDAALMLPGREIQIYYQGGTDPIWWGPIVRPQAGLHDTSWQCGGLLWYFGHRFMGRADRVNQLVNGDFEDGETDWTFNSVTHSTDATHVVEGTEALKLIGLATEGENWAKQIWTHPTGGYPGGDFLTLHASVWIDNATYVAPAIELRGLFASHRNASGDQVFYDATVLDDDTARGEWVEFEIGILSVQEDDTIDVRLYAPNGTVWWDLVTLTYMESLSFGYPLPAIDVTDIIKGIAAYAQDRPPYDFGHGKSDLNIDTAGVATGILRQIAYQFAEHRNILDSILEYVRQGHCDISIEFDATTRTFMVWPSATDVDGRGLGKGVLYGTTLELDVNLADFVYSVDLEQAASSVVLLGPGDGPDRPEGGAIDTSFVGGAFTSEIVEQAPDNTTVGQLDVRAQERLKVAARPEILEVTTLPGAGVIGNLFVGDTVPVVIATGWVSIDDTYRVARISVDLLKDQATITLNALP